MIKQLLVYILILVSIWSLCFWQGGYDDVIVPVDDGVWCEVPEPEPVAEPWCDDPALLAQPAAQQASAPMVVHTEPEPKPIAAIPVPTKKPAPIPVESPPVVKEIQPKSPVLDTIDTNNTQPTWNSLMPDAWKPTVVLEDRLEEKAPTPQPKEDKKPSAPPTTAPLPTQAPKPSTPPAYTPPPAPKTIPEATKKNEVPVQQKIELQEDIKPIKEVKNPVIPMEETIDTLPVDDANTENKAKIEKNSINSNNTKENEESDSQKEEDQPLVWDTKETPPTSKNHQAASAPIVQPSVAKKKLPQPKPKIISKGSPTYNAIVKTNIEVENEQKEIASRNTKEAQVAENEHGTYQKYDMMSNAQNFTKSFLREILAISLLLFFLMAVLFV